VDAKTGTPNPDAATDDTASVTGNAQGATPAPESVTATPEDATPRDAVRRAAARVGATPEEFVEMLRDVAVAIARDASLCDWCEDPIPEDRLRAGGRYCSENHRKEASRRRTARRRMFAERAARGETKGSCDVCGRACHIENALCDGCIDDLNAESRDGDSTGKEATS